MSLGEFDEAVAEMKRAAETAAVNRYIARMGLVCVLLRAGRRAEAVKVLDEVMSEPVSTYKSPTAQAMVKFDLELPDEAFSLLERAVSEHDTFLLYLRGFPWFADYSSDPRWAAIENKIRPSGD